MTFKEKCAKATKQIERIEKTIQRKLGRLPTLKCGEFFDIDGTLLLSTR